MAKVPCKITLEGDKDCARDFIGAAQSQLRILENQMSFQKLKQGVRRVRLNPRTTVEALICFNLREVKIYSTPLIIKIKEKEELEKLIPRFFAYVVKVNDIGEITRYYYWMYFVEAGTDMSGYEQTQYLSPIHLNDDYDVYVWSTQNPILEIMKNTPRGPDHLHKHPHRHTKAFMMDGRDKEIIEAALAEGEELKEERYVSACHMLTKNREIMFMPLHATAYRGIPPVEEICLILDTTKYPIYPLPYPGSFYLPYANNIHFTGLNFPCPPRRFYCNTEDGIMVWYSTNTTEDTARDFIGGIIFDVRNQRIGFFMLYPEDANGRGFDEYWAVMNPELPIPLLFDVQTLTKDGIDVTIAWSSRPINWHKDFSTGDQTYTQMETCNHQCWIGTDTGFEAKLFATLDQCLIEGEDERTEDSMSIPYVECVGENFDYPMYEQSASKNCTRSDRHDYHSSYILDFLGGKTISVVCDRNDLHVSEQCIEHVCRCSLGRRQCWGDDKTRSIESILQQQDTSTYPISRWIFPNGLHIFNHKTRQYCDGDAWQILDHCGGATPAEMADMCNWKNYELSPHMWVFNFAKCFYGFDQMPGDNWIRLDTDSICSWYITGWKWFRKTNMDENSSDFPRHFQIDKDLIFSFDDTDHVYYLDDRATDDNHGVIAAGKGVSTTELYPDSCLGVMEYKPDYWKIYWKVCWADNEVEDNDIPYIDITKKLLEALDCEDSELIDLGLI